MGVGFSSQVKSDKVRGNSLELCWGGLDRVLGKISSLKGWSGTGRGHPGQYGVTIPGGISRHMNGELGAMLAWVLQCSMILSGLFQPEWFYSPNTFFQGGKEIILAFD